MKVIVLGGVAAGLSAASRVKKLQPKSDVKVFEKISHISYGSCGIPYYISGLIKSVEELITFTPEQFEKERKVKVFLRHEAVKVDAVNRYVYINDKDAGKTKRYSYNKLIIATGAKAVMPDIEGCSTKGVFPVRNIEDAVGIMKYIDERKPKHAVIIGAGYIGMEITDALKSRGIDVTILEKSENVLGTMDNAVGIKVEQELRANSVQLVKNAVVKRFECDDKGLKCAVLESGERMSADIALIGAGVNPNTDFLKGTGIRLNKNKAVKINGRCETNIDNIYAAGDCATAKHIVTGKDVYIPLGTTANKQGRIAGANAGGGSEIFRGIAGTGAFKMFDLEVARTGISESEADKLKMNIVSCIVTHESKADYHPQCQEITVKLIADKRSGRLLGAEMSGREGVAKRIDVIAAALYGKMTVEDLSNIDMSYAPPFAPV